LYQYLVNMKDKEYFLYLKNIEFFLNTRRDAYEFTTNYYVNTIYQQIKRDIK